jgi:hypothetical protein
MSVTQRLTLVTTRSTAATTYVTIASHQEDPGRPQRVDVADLQHHGLPEVRNLRPAGLVGDKRHGRKDPARHRCRNEDHGQEQKPTAHENR